MTPTPSDRHLLVDEYLQNAVEASPRLLRLLRALDSDGRHALGDVLVRFDRDHDGHLGSRQRLVATRVLERVHDPSVEAFGTLDRILATLDVDRDAFADDTELQLVDTLFDLFATAESPQRWLSLHELQMVHAVVRSLDQNGSGVLDHEERRRLREHLHDPAAFLRWQLRDNVQLQALWARTGREQTC